MRASRHGNGALIVHELADAGLLLGRKLGDIGGEVGADSHAFLHGDDGSNEAMDWTAQIAPSYFNNRKVSIYGGSNEIQRNIITKAVLGLKSHHHLSSPAKAGDPVRRGGHGYDERLRLLDPAFAGMTIGGSATMLLALVSGESKQHGF